MNRSPKIVLVNASPRKYGSSYKLLSVASMGVIDAGGAYEWIDLYDYRIKECFGCVSDDQKICRYPCIIDDDDFNKVAKKLLESDGFVIATPVYWYSVPGPLKNFIDRLTSMENMIIHEGRSQLEGKVSGFIAVGADSGCIATISHLMVVFNSMGVHIPPWALAYSYRGEEAMEDEQAIRDSYNVGYIVARAASTLSSVVEWYNPRVNIKRLYDDVIREIVKQYSHKEERYKIYVDKLKIAHRGFLE